MQNKTPRDIAYNKLCGRIYNVEDFLIRRIKRIPESNVESTDKIGELMHMLMDIAGDVKEDYNNNTFTPEDYVMVNTLLEGIAANAHIL